MANKKQENQSTNMVNTQTPLTQTTNQHQQINKPTSFQHIEPEITVIQSWEQTDQDI